MNADGLLKHEAFFMEQLTQQMDRLILRGLERRGLSDEAKSRPEFWRKVELGAKVHSKPDGTVVLVHPNGRWAVLDGYDNPPWIRNPRAEIFSADGKQLGAVVEHFHGFDHDADRVDIVWQALADETRIY